MTVLSSLAVQMIDGLAGASTLFLLAGGLSLIFGVTRVVNFAHGSMYMIGLYVAVTLAQRLDAGGAGFWLAVLGASLAVAALGAVVELLVLRRVYAAPELLQLLATFAVVLVLRDAALAIWGAEDLLGPKAPGLGGSFEIFGRRLPLYDAFLIPVGPIVLGALWWTVHRTRLGTLIRAATQDREMVAALGVDEAWLFTGVFALGSALAGLGGALQLPREPANLALDLSTIGDAFVVVVVGGIGSIPGAYVAALLIAEVKALCYGIGTVTLGGVEFSFSKLTLVAEFLVMAAVLVRRPWGLLGRPLAEARSPAPPEEPIAPMGRPASAAVAIAIAALAAIPAAGDALPYSTVLLVDVMVAVLFAASLHFIMGPGGMHSFGHAAYFGLGAYGAALAAKHLAVPMEGAIVAGAAVACTGALVFGWFAVRLSGVYLAMLTLAFAQIVWSVVFQWDDFTGGSNGLVGVWPSERFASRAAYYWLVLALVVAALWGLRRVLFSPFGYAMRAGRDSALRAEATGIDVARVQWVAFAIAGLACGVAGALYAFAKGTISPEVISVARSVDALVMVLLGGVQTLAGPVVGAAAFTWLSDTVSRATEYWQATLGAVILVLVLAFPQGIAGGALAATRAVAARVGASLGRDGSTR